MKYKLYQVHISRAESLRLQLGDSMPKYEAWIMANCDGNPFPALEGRYYAHVADIDASNLDEAFDVGNIGPEDQIVRHNEMHSVSVGDLMVDPENHCWMVDRDGFRSLDNVTINAGDSE